MAKTKDFYEALGVPRTATQKEIGTAFRKLARKHHPDLNAGDKQAEARFKEISEAHEVLSDPKKKALYDEFGADWAAAQAAGVQPGAGGPRRGSGFRTDAGPSVQYRTVTPEEIVRVINSLAPEQDISDDETLGAHGEDQNADATDDTHERVLDPGERRSVACLDRCAVGEPDSVGELLARTQAGEGEMRIPGDSPIDEGELKLGVEVAEGDGADVDRDGDHLHAANGVRSPGAARVEGAQRRLLLGIGVGPAQIGGRVALL